MLATDSSSLPGDTHPAECSALNTGTTDALRLGQPRFMAGAAEELVGDPAAVTESVALLAQDLLDAFAL